MRSLGQIFKRILFWAYERGTWQYDIAVATVVVFVLLTPRSWFHDEPQVGLSAASGGVTLVETDGATRTYRVDARLLAPPFRTPELSNDLHNALQRAVPDLRRQGFSILRIDPIRDADGTVISYEVEVKR